MPQDVADAIPYLELACTTPHLPKTGGLLDQSDSFMAALTVYRPLHGGNE